MKRQSLVDCDKVMLGQKFSILSLDRSFFLSNGQRTVTVSHPSRKPNKKLSPRRTILKFGVCAAISRSYSILSPWKWFEFPICERDNSGKKSCNILQFKLVGGVVLIVQKGYTEEFYYWKQEQGLHKDMKENHVKFQGHGMRRCRKSLPNVWEIEEKRQRHSSLLPSLFGSSA